MSMGTPLRFLLPQSWTVRKVATALAREWLPPFRAEPMAKASRWIVQPVVEAPGANGHPLWERGISTQEFEERMERADLCWSVRATFGRGRATVLARLAICYDHASTFQIACNEGSFPESLFDAGKLDQVVAESGRSETEGLFIALLADHGFKRAAI